MTKNAKMVTLKIDNVVTYIDPPLKGQTYAEFKKKLGYKPQDSVWMAQANPHWDGWITTVCFGSGKCRCPNKKSQMHFPTGLLSLAREFFDNNQIVYQLVDDRPSLGNVSPLEIGGAYVLRDYQEEAVNNALKKQRGIIKAATGAGKTVIAGSIIAKAGAFPACFFVTTKDLLHQAKEELEKLIFKDGKPVKVGTIGGGKCDIQDINIVTVQTAIRSLGMKFDKFDEEDENDDSDEIIGDESKKKEIQKLISNTKLYIADECVTGDSIVTTKNFGPQKIVNLKNMLEEDILSFDGTSVVWRKITKFYDQGIKPLLNIELHNGNKIKCTENHPIMTQRGWVQAGELKENDQILCFANVDAKEESMLKIEVLANIQNIFWDIKFIADLLKNGKNYLTNSKKRLHIASVDVKKKLISAMELCGLLLKIKAVKNIANLSIITTKDLCNGAIKYLKLKNRLFLELYLAILLLYFRQIAAKIPGFNSITVWFKKIGQNINVNSCKIFLPVFGFIKTVVMEIKLYHLELHVCHAFLMFTKSLTKIVKNLLPKNGLIKSAQLAWRGGCVMMEVVKSIAVDYIQRAFHCQKLELALNGYPTNLEKLAYCSLKTNTTLSAYQKRQEEKYIATSKIMCPSAWSTKFVGIKKIDKIGSDNVFDITVENTHCFFANDILVHNCQHWAASTCQVVSDYCSSARYRFGISATPWRDMGDDLLIDACFGKLISNISASTLIEKKVLVPPKIYFVHTKTKLGGTFADVYRKGIVENTCRNTIIKNLAEQMVEDGRQTLILVRHIAHGEILQDMIPGSVFIHGSIASKSRQNTINRMKEGKHRCVIASSIFDEGVDIRPLSALILAGSGKSQTRALQRIGRVIRAYEGKTDAIIVDFFDDMKYMRKHSQARRRMYKTEPKFEISDIEADTND